MQPSQSRLRIPLVFASDESYAMPLATALRSIVETTNTVDAIDVYVLYSSFGSVSRARIAQTVPPGRLSLHWIPTDLTRFEMFSTSEYISTLTYARLLIPERLPRSLSRVLYLDADILALKDLSELRDFDLNGTAIGAVRDRIDSRIKAGETLWTNGIPWTNSLPSVKDYFNAGVLLIDLDRWREERISERALEYLREHPRSPLSDQDALNVACDGAWTRLETRWNFQNDCETRVTRMAVADRPAILHFNGQLKPWEIGVLDPNARLYDQIRSRTCFARTKRQKVTDAIIAPVKFYQSGLWWQIRRVLRRYEGLRRIWLFTKRLLPTIMGRDTNK